MLGFSRFWGFRVPNFPSLSALGSAGLVLVVSIWLSLCSPVAAQGSSAQFVYTADEATQNISGFQLNPATGAFVSIPGSPFYERLDPTRLALNPAGTFLFVANYAYNDVSVFQINQTTGALTELPGSPFSSANGTGPVALTTDPSGRFLYVANSVSLQVSEYGEIDVYEIDPATGALTPSPDTQSGDVSLCPIDPVGIFAHPNGKWVYVSGGYSPSLGADAPPVAIQGYAVDPETGDPTPLPASYDAPDWPWSLAGDASFLFDNWGENFGHVDTLAISPVDGSLTDKSTYEDTVNVGSIGIPEAADSTGQFLLTDLGVFQINQTTGALTLAQPYTGSALLQHWTASLISPFAFAGDNQNPLISSFEIDQTTGALTPAPGSPYATSAIVESIVVTGYPSLPPAPAANFLPTGVNFANTLVGQPATQSLGLYNTGTATLNISGISITGAQAGSFSQRNNCPASLAAGSNCTIIVTFTPGDAAQFSAALGVSDDAAGSPQLAQLAGVGINPSPAISLSPASYSFSATNIGSTSSPQTFTLANSGTAALELSSLSLSGPNPGDFTESNTCGESVNAGSNCIITVSFAPKAKGVRTATVSIADNAADSPQSISLSGTGDEPFSVAPVSQGGASAAMSATGSASYNLQVSPAASFAGTISLSCAGAPASSVCTVSPASFQATGNTAVSVMVTISAMTAGSSLPEGAPHFSLPTPGELLLPLCLAAFSFVLLLAERASRRLARSQRLRPSAVNVAVLVAAMGVMLMASACGGTGSSQLTGPQAGVQPGQYSLTVTASSGAASQSLALTLNVSGSQ